MKTRVYNGKEQIFCEWRRRYVRLTPEEYVRQCFLHRLVEEYGYPKELIAVEVALEDAHPLENTTQNGKKRADAIVYDLQMQPLMIIEFKADKVALTQRTLDQASAYNRRVRVPYLILHNGMCSVIAHISDSEIVFAKEIPNYGELNRIKR